MRLSLNRILLVQIVLLLLTAGCRQDMHDQPRYEAFEASDFFEDGRASRPLVEGTVAQGQLRLDEHLYTGKINGELAVALPVPLTRQLLERGQERFDIYCSPCHDRAGSGQGIVVRRGFRRPSSFHIDRLREAPIGYFFEVMTNGFGAMMDYAVQSHAPRSVGDRSIYSSPPIEPICHPG